MIPSLTVVHVKVGLLTATGATQKQFYSNTENRILEAILLFDCYNDIHTWFYQVS